MPASLPPPRHLRSRPRHLRSRPRHLHSRPRHLRCRPRHLSAPVRWLLLLALTAPLVAGAAGVGQRTAAAAPGSPAAVAVRFALAQLGKPYRWGANGPASFDCSGLVQTAYKAAGVGLPRVSRQQYGAGRLVPLSRLRAGDLLFFARDTGDPRTINHVGMYLGRGRMVEAPNRRAPVRIASIWRPGLLGKATRPAAGLRGLLPVELGERSNAVVAVQLRLTANRLCVAVDGEFGPLTRRALLAFQRAHGLTPDGVVGPSTWGALVTYGRQRSPARC
ncbi:MAG TPA: NlpC/P60 family protein [Actinomycetes bacterium]|nr:NlpC/P60 family protein [Actinomycetes bacterium]